MKKLIKSTATMLLSFTLLIGTPSIASAADAGKIANGLFGVVTGMVEQIGGTIACTATGVGCAAGALAWADGTRRIINGAKGIADGISD